MKSLPDLTARPPARMAHLGLGAFHRSHQAWYTARANESSGEAWGIVAFTGRRPDAADALRAQDCRYTLVTRSADGDSSEVIDTIVDAHDGADVTAWRNALASVDIVTVTVTEQGYSWDEDLAVEELRVIRADSFPATPIGRLVDGLMARRAAGGGPLAIVACDNLDGNGELLRRGVGDLARRLDPDVAEWVEENASFVSSVVDRITPAIPSHELHAAIDGRPDACAVVAEPVSSWYLSGDFPAGRPAWEEAGAQFVDDVSRYEKRKLWLLNAAHTALALLGQLRRHESVAEAMGDDACIDLVERLWDDAAAVLPFTFEEIAEERARLVERFRNPRIRHQLSQIAKSSALKLAVRVRAVIDERLRRGLPVGSAQIDTIAAWAVAVSHGLVPGEATDDPEAHARDFLLHSPGVPDDAFHQLTASIDALKKGFSA